MHGRLRLHFAYEAQSRQTVLHVCEQEPPLRVVHAFAQQDGSTLLHVHNLSGGVLGGDQFTLEVELAPSARVQLTTTGATRLYRSRSDALMAYQESTIRVGVGGLLEYVPDQLIPFAGSRYRQVTRIELEQDAGVFWWETIAPGRLARGECFAFDLLQIEMTICAAGLPIASERLRLQPQQTPLNSLVRLGAFRYHTSFFICRVGLAASVWSQLERTLTEMAQQYTRKDELVWGVSTLTAHGLVVRAVSKRGYDVGPGLLAFWRVAKRLLYQAEAIPPRKLY